MKLLIALCILAVVSLSLAKPENLHPRGRYYLCTAGECDSSCEEGTHVRSCSHKTPEPTCEEPNPVPEKHFICDHSACYCDAPTVRDTAIGQCVVPEKCPKKV